jgi:trehalose/maltose hydrolase-like predicted phosphorylase
MLRYRVHRLAMAASAAAAAGLPGARFPWESADDGCDATPQFAQWRDGKVVPVRTGEQEEHVVADVAWAASEYTAWSGDEAFLRGEGRDLVLAGARYWAARIRLDRAGAGHVYGVIGPDEYHESVDDNAFTNVMVRWHLRRAARLAEHVGGAGADELAKWRELAGAIVDGYQPDTGRYEQFAGYNALDPLLVADIATPPVAADMLLGRQAVRGSQLIKQPDVLMLHHLVPAEVVPGSLAPNLDFYGPRTAHGSSLSPAIQAAVLARAGRTDEALDLFRVAARLDLDDLTETTAGGLHLATMGGLWQALAYGFLGLRPGTSLTIDPHLPAGWDRVELRLRFHGAHVGLVVAPTEVEVTSDRPISVRAGHGVPRRLGPGSTTIELRREAR